MLRIQKIPDKGWFGRGVFVALTGGRKSSMDWEIRYRSSVEKDVERLPAGVRSLVLRTLAELSTDPFPEGCKKLRGSESRFRLRVAGSYRIVYKVFQVERLIEIEFVGHRKDAYRWF
jgi:mRNA interferase RelE/StbE